MQFQMLGETARNRAGALDKKQFDRHLLGPRQQNSHDAVFLAHYRTVRGEFFLPMHIHRLAKFCVQWFHPQRHSQS